MAKRSKRTGITADRVLREIAKIAFVKATDVIDPRTGAVKSEASDEDLATIQSIKIKEVDGENMSSVEREVKLADKSSALTLLCKHLGLTKDRVENIVEPGPKFADICSQIGGKGLSE